MEKINIGVYRNDDPINVSGEERLEAALKEAEKNNIRLVFFNDDSIIFSQNMVKAQYKDKDRWRTIRTYIPEVTINPLPTVLSNRTEIEKRLRQISRFTAYGVMGKYDVYKKLRESEEYKKYAIESIKVNDYREVFNSLDNHGKVVLKPIDGRQGMGIYSISRSKDNYIVLEDDKETAFKEESFKMFIDTLVGEGEHIVQPYIECLTKKGEPYDFRVHLHRDGKGEWAVVKSYPRIGSPKGILSNISRGGRTLEINKFLKEEFGDNYKSIRKEIESIAIDLADYINSFSVNPINEIGVDLAIDKDGNYYTYELNGGPESRYHEEERAKYVIEYAKYLYEKELEKKYEKHLQYVGSELLKVESKLLAKDFEDEIYIGILTYPGDNDHFNIAAGHVAAEKEINIFHFYPSDIDYKNKRINGRYYDRGNLKRRVYIYPDIIIDRLRMRGFKDFEELYSEFKDIDFNTDTKGGSASKSYAYELIRDKKLKKHIIPYKLVESVNDVFNFLENFNSIIIKPDRGTKGHNVMQIKKYDNRYKLIMDDSKEIIKKTEIKEKLNKTLNLKERYIVQKHISSIYKDSRPFDIRIHMAKGENGAWNIVKKYVKVGARNKLTSNSIGGGYIGKLAPIIENKYPGEEDYIYTKISKLSYELSYEIDSNIDGRISEIGYDLGLTDSGDIYIYEINLNKPNPLFFEYDLAYRLIDYSIYLNSLKD